MNIVNKYLLLVLVLSVQSVLIVSQVSMFTTAAIKMHSLGTQFTGDKDVDWAIKSGIAVLSQTSAVKESVHQAIENVAKHEINRKHKKTFIEETIRQNNDMTSDEKLAATAVLVFDSIVPCQQPPKDQSFGIIYSAVFMALVPDMIFDRTLEKVKDMENEDGIISNLLGYDSIAGIAFTGLGFKAWNNIIHCSLGLLKNFGPAVISDWVPTGDYAPYIGSALIYTACLYNEYKARKENVDLQNYEQENIV